MHLDVQDLKNFYYRQSLGRAVQRVVRKEVVRHWPDTTGQTVVGFGFAVPLLRPFLAKSRRVIALMPGPQGVMHWPAGAPNVSVITDEFSWPLETGHVDRLVLFHGLENCEHPADMLEEARRVLGPGGAGVVHRAKSGRDMVAHRCDAIWVWETLFIGAVGNAAACKRFFP